MECEMPSGRRLSRSKKKREQEQRMLVVETKEH